MKQIVSNFIIRISLFLFDYNHIATLFFLLISLNIFRVYDREEIRSEYYLSKEFKKTWGILDHKWYPSSGPEVVAYDFSFVLPERGMYRGTSYSKFDKFNEQDSVLVEYYPVSPSYARIIRLNAMQRSQTILWLGVFLFFVSISWLIASFVKFNRRVNIFKNGELKKVSFKDYKSELLYGNENSESVFDMRMKTYTYKSKGTKENYRFRSIAWKQVRLMEDEQLILVTDKGYLHLNRFLEYLVEMIKKYKS